MTVLSNAHLTRFVAILFSRSHDPLATAFPRMRSSAPSWKHKMDSKEGRNSEKFVTIESGCEYKALKECLDRNKGRKEKCEKEWAEFQNLCARNKR